MFQFKDQLEDMKQLWKAMDEAEASPPCENFPDAFFPDYEMGGSTALNNIAKSLCGDCPIREQCLEYGIRWEPLGIYGGVSPKVRQEMRRKLVREGHYLPDLNEGAA